MYINHFGSLLKGSFWFSTFGMGSEILTFLTIDAGQWTALRIARLSKLHDNSIFESDHGTFLFKIHQ